MTNEKYAIVTFVDGKTEAGEYSPSFLGAGFIRLAQPTQELHYNLSHIRSVQIVPRDKALEEQNPPSTSAKQKAVLWAQHIAALPDNEVVVLDTETNGWGKDFQTEIIQVSVIDQSGKVLVDDFVRPRAGYIQQQAIDVHGITYDMVREAPTFDTLWNTKLRDALSGKIILVYNVDFDRERIMAAMRAYNLSFDPPPQRWECVMHEFAAFYGAVTPGKQGFTWQKLEKACGYFNIHVEEKAHSALGDVRRTLEVVKRMAVGE